MTDRACIKHKLIFTTNNCPKCETFIERLSFNLHRNSKGFAKYVLDSNDDISEYKRIKNEQCD